MLLFLNANLQIVLNILVILLENFYINHFFMIKSLTFFMSHIYRNNMDSIIYIAINIAM
jgi:hypothetical protein